MQKGKKIKMRQALFLIFDNLNAIKESTKKFFFFKVIKKVVNLYIENIGN